MLNNTLTYRTNALVNENDGVLTKMSTDEQTGTRYKDLGVLPSGIMQRTLLVKHQGNASSQKHLISLQTEVQKTDQPRVRCTVNVTVTAHPSLSDEDMVTETLALVSTLVGSVEPFAPSSSFIHVMEGAY